jgi:DNA-binding MarR family transcriptional regulator
MVRNRMELNGGARDVAINYVTFRLDVLTAIAKNDASLVYERECGVSLKDLRVLRFVALEPGLVQGRLATLCYLEKTLTSKMVTALVKRGLLRRKIGAEDARQVRLYLTAQGTRIVDRCEVLGREIEGSMMSVLSEEERRVFEHCVERITAGLLLQRESAPDRTESQD